MLGESDEAIFEKCNLIRKNRDRAVNASSRPDGAEDSGVGANRSIEQTGYCINKRCNTLSYKITVIAVSRTDMLKLKKER